MTRSENFDAGALLDRVKRGEPLTGPEVQAVADRLRDPASEGKYTLIHILGAANCTAYKTLVAEFLDYPANPMLARIALMTLCNFWGMTDEFLVQVHAFARGVAWDEEDQVRQIALSILGQYVRTHPQDAISIQLLLAIAEDEEEDELLREDAVRALARGQGAEWDEMPPASRREPLDSLWSQDVLGRAIDSAD